MSHIIQHYLIGSGLGDIKPILTTIFLEFFCIQNFTLFVKLSAICLVLLFHCVCACVCVCYLWFSLSFLCPPYRRLTKSTHFCTHLTQKNNPPPPPNNTNDRHQHHPQHHRHLEHRHHHRHHQLIHHFVIQTFRHTIALAHRCTSELKTTSSRPRGSLKPYTTPIHTHSPHNQRQRVRRVRVWTTMSNSQLVDSCL